MTDHLRVLGEDGERFAQAAGKDLAAHVPSCPEWSMRDLVVHLGQVHRRWTERARPEGTQKPGVPDEVVAPPADAAAAALLDWYREGLAGLVALLDGIDPDRPTWNWTGRDQRSAWVRRRMAQETAVHRWDAQNAVGDAEAIAPPAFAADGVDEVLRVWLPDEWTGPSGSVHLHSTDTDGEWLVRLGPDGPVVEDGHSKADIAVRGTASDLDLVLWGRYPPKRLEHSGDGRIFDAFLAWLRED